MVSREVKKLQKKRAKEKENKKKILAERMRRRAAASAEKKAERAERERDKRISKLVREMDDFEHLPEDKLKELPDETLSQLERNAKILQALEDEYGEEAEKKRVLNESLEDQGIITLEDKLQALQQQNIATAQEDMGLAGSAECVFNAAPTPPKPKKDTAEVEVIKAETENS